jgi:hypothetical protein
MLTLDPLSPVRRLSVEHLPRSPLQLAIKLVQTIGIGIQGLPYFSAMIAECAFHGPAGIQAGGAEPWDLKTEMD